MSTEKKEEKQSDLKELTSNEELSAEEIIVRYFEKNKINMDKFKIYSYFGKYILDPRWIEVAVKEGKLEIIKFAYEKNVFVCPGVVYYFGDKYGQDDIESWGFLRFCCWDIHRCSSWIPHPAFHEEKRKEIRKWLWDHGCINESVNQLPSQIAPVYYANRTYAETKSRAKERREHNAWVEFQEKNWLNIESEHFGRLEDTENWWDIMCDIAVEVNNLEFLQWCVDKGYPLPKDVLSQCVKNGYYGMFEWISKYQKSFYVWSKNIAQQSRGGEMALPIELYEYIILQEEQQRQNIEVKQAKVRVEKKMIAKFKKFVKEYKIELDSPIKTHAGFAAFCGNVEMLELMTKDSREFVRTDSVFRCAIGSPAESDAAFEYFKPILLKLKGKHLFVGLSQIAAGKCNLTRLQWLCNVGGFSVDESTLFNAVFKGETHRL